MLLACILASAMLLGSILAHLRPVGGKCRSWQVLHSLVAGIHGSIQWKLAVKRLVNTRGKNQTGWPTSNPDSSRHSLVCKVQLTSVPSQWLLPHKSQGLILASNLAPMPRWHLYSGTYTINTKYAYKLKSPSNFDHGLTAVATQSTTFQPPFATPKLVCLWLDFLLRFSNFPSKWLSC